MRRGGIRRFLTTVAAMAALAAAPAGTLAGSGSAAGVGGRATVTMEELKVRGYEPMERRLFFPPVPDLFHRSPVRYDLIREDLAKPIPLSKIGGEAVRTGGYLVDDD